MICLQCKNYNNGEGNIECADCIPPFKVNYKSKTESNFDKFIKWFENKIFSNWECKYNIKSGKKDNKYIVYCEDGINEKTYKITIKEI